MDWIQLAATVAAAVAAGLGGGAVANRARRRTEEDDPRSGALPGPSGGVRTLAVLQERMKYLEKTIEEQKRDLRALDQEAGKKIDDLHDKLDSIEVAVRSLLDRLRRTR